MRRDLIQPLDNNKTDILLRMRENGLVLRLVGQPEELTHLLLVGGATMGRRRYQRIPQRLHSEHISLRGLGQIYNAFWIMHSNEALIAFLLLR